MALRFLHGAISKVNKEQTPQIANATKMGMAKQLISMLWKMLKYYLKNILFWIQYLDNLTSKN